MQQTLKEVLRVKVFGRTIKGQELTSVPFLSPSRWQG